MKFIHIWNNEMKMPLNRTSLKTDPYIHGVSPMKNHIRLGIDVKIVFCDALYILMSGGVSKNIDRLESLTTMTAIRSQQLLDFAPNKCL